MRGLEMNIPDLAEHWRQVFTLLWLLMAAIARNDLGNPGAFAAKIMWAAVCALFAAVAAGLQPLTDARWAMWTIGGFFVFYSVLSLRDVIAGREKWTQWILASVFLVAVGALGSFIVTGNIVAWVASADDTLTEKRAAFGLLWLVFLVA